MNLAAWLHQTGRARPDAPAIRSGARLHATYAQFSRRSWAVGRRLASRHGIGPGDRVALFARNRPEYLEIIYGALWIGAIIVPINSKLHPREAAWIIGDSGARLAITETGTIFADAPDIALPCPELGIEAAELAAAQAMPAEVPAPPVPASDDDVAWLFYTSGTTGRPKGVMIAHGNLRAMATSYALDVDAVLPGDHVLYAAPMSHGAGLYNFQFVRAGACHVIPGSRGFDPAEILDLAGALGDLVFFAAPTMVTRLLRHAEAQGHAGDGIRTIIYGGGPMYLADIDRALRAFGPRFVQIYGQGECPMAIAALPRDLVADVAHPNAEARRASVGIAQSCVEVRIVDASLRDLPAGETGEIVVRGSPVMKGYWRNAAATAATLVDGWLRTGDLGRLDEDGFLTLTDRSKDVIISGGTNIYPREVEEALLMHPDVAEVSVVGHPHPDWGEEVVAFVVLNAGAQPDEAALEGCCRARIASFKKPRRYVFLPELPKNSYGKVLKTALRDRAAPPDA